MNQKIVVRLFCLVAWVALWLIMPGMKALEALEVYKILPEPLYDCRDSARRETGKVLHPDFAMNPYYLRLDLDGDNKMDYVTILVDESEKVRRGLLVCSSEGKATFYQGMTDRIVTGDGTHQRLSSDTDEPWGIVADTVLSEERSSQTIPPEPYTIIKCCEVNGEMTTDYEKSSQTIPVGLSWDTHSKSEVLEILDSHNVPVETGNIAGEGIGSIWEVTYTVGFMDGNRFRWLILTVGDSPE